MPVSSLLESTDDGLAPESGVNFDERLTPQRSKIEQLTGQHYQHDGGQLGDSSDLCLTADPTVYVGQQFSGLLVPIDDPLDHYALQVNSTHANLMIKVRLDPAPFLNSLNPPVPDYDLNLWDPGCAMVIKFSHNDGSVPDEVTFTPNGTGEFVIQITPGSNGPPLRAAAVCHGICIALVNGTVGYVVRSCIVGTLGC